MVNKPHGTKRRKIINLRHQFIRQQLAHRRTAGKHVPAEDQKVDMFTKPLMRVDFKSNLKLSDGEEPSRHDRKYSSRQGE